MSDDLTSPPSGSSEPPSAPPPPAAAPPPAPPPTAPPGEYPVMSPYPPVPAGRGKALGHRLSGRSTGWIVAALLFGAVVGLSVAVAEAPTRTVVAGSAPAGSSSRPAPRQSGPGSGFPGFRFLPGRPTTGTVDSLTKSGFTMTAADGTRYTVKETSSTVLRNLATTPGRKHPLARGDRVTVIGTITKRTITASTVLLAPAGTKLGGPPPTPTS